jgi:hypothetical protein
VKSCLDPFFKKRDPMMRTYRGVPLEDYSKEQLIEIVERVWGLYQGMVDENIALFGRCAPSRTFRITRIIIVALALVAALALMVHEMRTWI